jgi:3-hydroxymyristoyl/3-hydroxydecanoyl-(acyl carrier protein) dehydratase
MTTGSIEICFAQDHPTAAGHFPGNPILPGALLLDAIVQAISPGGPLRGATIPTVKFLRPVRPGDRMCVEWEQKGEDTRFTCILSASGETAVTGVMRLSARPE